MATQINFTTLLQDLQNYLERGASASQDPSVFNQLPRLINAAERIIMVALKLQGMIEVLQDAKGLAIGKPTVDKPDRYRQTVSMAYGAGTNKNVRTPLLPRSYEYCRAYWPDDSVTDPTQPPLFYADYDAFTKWLIVPTPPDTFPLEVLAYMQPPLLDASNQTNFFTIYTPNLLLYAALLEATPFLKNDPRIATWQENYNREVGNLLQQDLQKILDRGAQRRMA